MLAGHSGCSFCFGFSLGLGTIGLRLGFRVSGLGLRDTSDMRRVSTQHRRLPRYGDQGSSPCGAKVNLKPLSLNPQS